MSQIDWWAEFSKVIAQTGLVVAGVLCFCWGRAIDGGNGRTFLTVFGISLAISAALHLAAAARQLRRTT